MTEREFCYWLQGYFEILDPARDGLNIPLGAKQVQCIQEHLQLVFTHKVGPQPSVQQRREWERQVDWQRSMGGGGVSISGGTIGDTFAVC